MINWKGKEVIIKWIWKKKKQQQQLNLILKEQIKKWFSMKEVI